jgi:hypothetical protein
MIFQQIAVQKPDANGILAGVHPPHLVSRRGIHHPGLDEIGNLDRSNGSAAARRRPMTARRDGTQGYRTQA